MYVTADCGSADEAAAAAAAAGAGAERRARGIDAEEKRSGGGSSVVRDSAVLRMLSVCPLWSEGACGAVDMVSRGWFWVAFDWFCVFAKLLEVAFLRAGRP